MKDNKEMNGVSQSPMERLELLQETIRRQEAALQAKGRLVDNMAYQIRTLSNAVVGFSDLLLTEEMTDEQHDYALEINTAGKGLSTLVNEVLDWARLESGRLQVTRNAYSVRSILKELEEIVRPVATDKGLAFAMQLDASLPETVITDSERLVKCLINLAANAIHYTPEGFVHIAVRPQIRDGRTYVRFDIIDSGPGIPAEKLGRLFEPVIDEEDAHAQVVNMISFGLSVAAGLPLTRQLVELLGGHIDVQSEVGKGSTFTLLIPAGADSACERTPEEADPAIPREEAWSPEEASSHPILLAEDQESNRTVIRLMLKTLGYEVDTAVDGQEAVEMALSKQYSLIIMDLKMPRMDGYEATRRLRERQIKTPIIALSALSLSGEEKSRTEEIFDGFLSKPIDSEQLLAAIDRYAVGAAVNRLNRAGSS
ncbi:MAG: response regulator [Phycisphaerae bacterium]|nr:response regulator [Phycisphaerae bacterium]